MGIGGNLPTEGTNKQQKGVGIEIYTDREGPDNKYVPKPDSKGFNSELKKEVVDGMTQTTKATSVPTAGDIGEAAKNIATSIEKGVKAGIIVKDIISDDGSHVDLKVDSIRYSVDTKNFGYVGVTISGKETTFQTSKSQQENDKK